jgi:hypothetical protein
MNRHLRVWLPLSSLIVVLSFAAPPVAPLTRTTSAAQPGTPPQVGSALLSPLPSACIGALPPGAGVPVCCMFGYVLLDGEPVEGAKLTITSAHGTLEGWTERSPDNEQPFYRVSLSDPPVSAQEGETITIMAEYRCWAARNISTSCCHATRMSTLRLRGRSSRRGGRDSSTIPSASLSTAPG